jgi:hypothetical protein
MYKVAKQMVRMKDTLINQRHQQTNGGFGSSNYATNTRLGGTFVQKKDEFLTNNGADIAMRNTIGSPLKTHQGDVNPFSAVSPIDSKDFYQNNSSNH